MADFRVDNKGNIAVFITIFVGAIIAIVFMASFSTDINRQTNTFTTFNLSVTAPTAPNGTVEILGRELVGSISVTNATSGEVIEELTGDDELGTRGLMTIRLVINDTERYSELPVNLSYTYVPDGYLNNSGARSLDRLILIMAALAILIFVIVMLIKQGSFNELFKR